MTETQAQFREKVFKSASTTYYNASLFFPKEVREDVFILYAFVRIVDNFVDNNPQEVKKFYDFWDAYLGKTKIKGKNMQVIKDFRELALRKKFNPRWIDAFFKSMESDIKKPKYKTMKQTLVYIYGSADVIGLMMSRILNLDPSLDKYAGLLGRAYQYINFLRDIQEDNDLGRLYFAEEILRKYGLKNLKNDGSPVFKKKFTKFLRSEILRYKSWYQEACEAFGKIPRRYRIALMTATKMYDWTADELYKNPLLVFKQKVKPNKWQVLIVGVVTLFKVLLRF